MTPARLEAAMLPMAELQCDANSMYEAVTSLYHRKRPDQALDVVNYTTSTCKVASSNPAAQVAAAKQSCAPKTTSAKALAVAQSQKGTSTTGGIETAADNWTLATSSSPTPVNSQRDSSHSAVIGVVVVGAVSGIALVIVIMWICCRRRLQATRALLGARPSPASALARQEQDMQSITVLLDPGLVRDAGRKKGIPISLHAASTKAGVERETPEGRAELHGNDAPGRGSRFEMIA